jgi:serine/threonine protein kinase
MEKCECSIVDKVAEVSATDTDLTDMFRQMLKGIAHVHKMGVVHRDIKPDNFLFGGPDGKTVKLCDFGLAAPLPQKSGALRGVFGTAPYMSPEMVAQKPYDMLTDVWSFGACAHLMVFGFFPYMPKKMTAGDMKQAIMSNAPKLTFSTAEGDPVYPASNFVQTILKRKTNERCSAEAALELPFLKPKPASAHFFENFDAAPALRKARKLTNQTKELTKPINPIVQRSIDELLKTLRSQGKLESAGGGMFFSERGDDEPEMVGTKSEARTEPEDDRIISRRELRTRTHSGVLSHSLSTSDLATTTASAEGSTTEGSISDDLSGRSSVSRDTRESQGRKESKDSRHSRESKDGKNKTMMDIPQSKDDGIKWCSHTRI